MVAALQPLRRCMGEMWKQTEILTGRCAVTHPLRPFSGTTAVALLTQVPLSLCRVTWVFMIICILFFEMQLSTALWSGIIAGIG